MLWLISFGNALNSLVLVLENWYRKIFMFLNFVFRDLACLFMMLETVAAVPGMVGYIILWF